MKRFLNIFLTITLLLVLAACGGSEWQQQYDLGVKYMSEGNYEEAIIAFTAAIEIDEKQVLAYLGRGGAYIGLGETDENLALALADYEQVIALDESNADGYLGIADVYIRQGEYEKALEILRKGYETTGSERFLELIQKYEDSFVQKQDYVEYAQFSEADRDYLESLFETLKTEDLTAIRVFLLEKGEPIGKIVVNTSPNYKRLDASEGAERRIYFGTCSTDTIISSGEKAEISCNWIEDEGNIRDSTYTVEIHPEQGQGYYIAYTDYGDDYRISYVSGQCVDWNWDGAYRGCFYYVKDGKYVGDNGHYTATWCSGDYTTGTASEGLVNGTEVTRAISELEIDIDAPVFGDLTATMSKRILECDGGRVISEYEIDDDGSKYQLEIMNYFEDSLLLPTGYLVPLERREEIRW